MSVFGASFGCHEVIGAVELVEVGAFDPDWVVGGIGALVDKDDLRSHGLIGGDVELACADGAMAVVLWRAFRNT